MEFVDLRDSRDHDLLEQVYRDLYLKNFTDPDEQEDLEQYQVRLFGPPLPMPQPVTHFLVAGENLVDPANRVINGFLIFELYRESSCGLLTYLAVAPDARRQGLGRLLISRAIEILERDMDGGLVAVFGETHDPRKIDASQDAMVPHDRIGVMSKLGARRVPIRYVQPALRPGDGRSDKLLLISFPIASSPAPWLSGVAVLTFLDEFYRALGVSNPSMDADLQASRADVEAAERGFLRPEFVVASQEVGLPLVPLAEPKVTTPPSNILALLLSWVLAIAWVIGFPYLVLLLFSALPSTRSFREMMSWNRTDYSYFTEIQLLHFLMTVVRGAGAFLILGWPYRTPFMMLVRSTFHDDMPPVPQFQSAGWSTVGKSIWSAVANPYDGSRRVMASIRRMVEMLFYYKNALSLSAVRRFLYVATHPILYWKFWRFLDVTPNRIYTKLQIYFEAEIFNPRITTGEGAMSANEYGEHIGEIYAQHLYQLDEGLVPLATCKTCFAVFGKNQKRIETYFKAQQSVHRDPQFLTRIAFETGYLAPTYLVSGLLSEFEDDWTKIVDSYQEKMQRLGDKNLDPLAELPDLRKLQTFIWDCWVQWGPSVPISRSIRWRIGEVALQFGYGDENNSLPIRLSKAGTGNQGIGSVDGYWFENWMDKFDQRWDQARQLDPAARAWPVTVTGTLRCLIGPNRNQNFCIAQRDTRANDEDGWMVFDAERIEPDLNKSKFYSAYVWVLIAICKSTNSEPHSNAESQANAIHSDRGYRLIECQPADAWRCLIPYFQHGNIAEGSVFQSIKRELAEKTVDSMLQELMKADAAGQDWLHFAYVAAFDDNGDGVSDPLVSSSDPPIKRLLETALRSRIDRDAATANPQFSNYEKRIHLQLDSLPELTACQLPRIVRNYLDHVERSSIATTSPSSP